MQKIAKGLSLISLIGLIGLMFTLHVCSSGSLVFSSSAKPTCSSDTANNAGTPSSSSCEESLAVTSNCETNTVESKPSMPSDLGITRILTPVISQYLAEFLPRLVH